METCENCNRAIGNLETPCLHEGHVVCAECYGRLHESVSTTSIPPLLPESGSPRVSCPHCGGAHVVSAPAAYEQGTSTKSASHLSVAFTGDGMVPIIGGSSGVQSSLAANKLAPPAKLNRAREYQARLTMVAVVVFIGTLVISVIVGSSIKMPKSDIVPVLVLLFSPVTTILVTIGLFSSNREVIQQMRISDDAQYQKSLRLWRSTWYCSQCGQTFVVQ